MSAPRAALRPPPRTRPPAAALALLATLALAASAAAPAPPPVLRAPARVRADADFFWSVPLTLERASGVALHRPSLTLVSLDLDRGNTRGARARRDPQPQAIAAGLVAGTRSAATVEWRGPAVAEHAWLTFVLRATTGAGDAVACSTTVEALPGAFSRAHPSGMLWARGRRVEVVFVAPQGADGPAPGVLLVHGHASHARLMLSVARALAARGLAVMCVSMPGYGRSAGPADFCGPATLAALEAALDTLAREPGVDPKRLGAWGLSRGAEAVALLAARRGELSAAVLQSGVYDLWAVHRGTTLAGFPAAIVAEAGRDSAGWRARSPVFEAARIRAALLVLHGEHDTVAPAAQARGFSAAVAAAGGRVEARFLSGVGHALPAGRAEATAIDFLARRLRAGGV